MRRIIPLAVIATLFVACGGGEETPEPSSLQSCDAVAVAAIEVIQDSIDIVDEALTTGEEPDPSVTESIEVTGAALEAQAAVLGCTDEQMSALMADLAAGLQAESVFGQLIIEGLTAGEGAFFEDG
jgi:hypothetical protein